MSNPLQQTIEALAKEKAAAGAAMSDQQFVDFAAQTDMVEANLGQMAASVGSAQPVKDYGQMLTADHTKDFGQLYSVAHQANLNMPSAIDAEHNKAMIDPFTRDEIRALLETASAKFGDWHPFLLCAVRSGLRLGELRALEWRDSTGDSGSFESNGTGSKTR